MPSNKLPEPKELSDEMRTECTCEIYNWSEHTCPFAEDVNDDSLSLCNCCPYCEYEYAMDV